MRRWWWAPGLCLLSSLAVAGAEPFLRRFALILDGNAAYYSLTVPQPVYAASLSGDLSDVRVYNGKDEPVPYSLDGPAATAPPPQRRTVSWFPLPSAGARDAPLGVSIAADGSLHATATPPATPSRSGDLVDLGRIAGSDAALLVHLANDSYQGSVSVEASDDLRDWQPVTETQLLKVAKGDNALVQERIDLEGLHARYVRLRWLDAVPDIASVELETRGDTATGAALPRQWRAAIHVRPGAAPGEYWFETDGAYPVDRLRFSLPQANTVAHVTLSSRANAQSPWHDVAEGALFRLHEKTGEETSPPFDLAADTDRQWRLVVDMRNGGLGSGPLAVTVGWRPATLTFLARGDPPFSLAAGNISLPSTALSRADLLVGAGTVVARAQVGAMLPVTAEQMRAATAVTDAGARRRYILWAALLLAVVVLGGVAWRLAGSSAER